MDHLRRGTPTRFTASVTDSGTGEAGDPANLVFAIGREGMPPTTYELSKGTVKRSDTGEFYVELTLTRPGQWMYRWRAFGATITQQEVHFVVD